MSALAEISTLPQWVNWNGGKKPLTPGTAVGAKANDPSTWGTYDEAIAADPQHIGFEVKQPHTFIDLDHCRDPESGEVSPEAREILDSFDTYKAVSSSGTGFQLLLRGQIPPHTRTQATLHSCGVEIYSRGRFMAWTGDQYGECAEINDCQAALSALHEQVKRAAEKTRKLGLGEGRDNELTRRLGIEVAKGVTGAALKARAAELNDFDPPLTGSEVEKILRSAAQWANPAGARVVCLEDVQPEEVSWLWPARVPLGKLTLLMGDPGLLKSTLTLYMAAKVTTGGEWPDGVALAGSSRAPVGDVVLLTAEDGLADTVRPRLDLLGADSARVWALQAVRVPGEAGERTFNLLKDIAALERVVSEKCAVLVIIDPLNAYLAGADSHKAAEVRQALSPLVAMAERCGVAVVVVLHLNKSDPSVNALYRASGSLDFVAVARSVLGVAPDPKDEGRVLLVPVKLNIARKPEGLGFRREETDLVFDGQPVSCNAQAAFAAKPRTDTPEMAKAKAFLERVLGFGELVAQKLIQEEAEEENITSRTLERAKGELHVKSTRPGGAGPWYWRLEVQG